MNRQALLTGLLRLTARLSLPVAHAIGTALGWLLGRIPNPMRRIAARNLALVFPAMTEADRHRLLRANLMETGKLLLELGPLWLWPGARVLALVRDSVAGEEALAAAVQQKQGAILLTPHLGSWEVAGLYYSSRHPLTILYRPSRLGLDELSVRGRGRLGGNVVATGLSSDSRDGAAGRAIPARGAGPARGGICHRRCVVRRHRRTRGALAGRPV